MHTIDLSIIILTYKTKDITIEAIKSIENNYHHEVASGKIEVIIVDNGSQDGSMEVFENYKKHSKIKSFHIIDTGANLGFAGGNNRGVPYAKGRYILFLNSDTIVYPRTLTYMIDFMDQHQNAGAATCKVKIPSGGIDEASHRGFPTPWNSFSHFSGLEKLFPKVPLFTGYIQGWKDLNTIHEVDAVVGAFLMVRREIGKQISWWDEDYFFYGEDLQFCYNIHKLGYKIYYVPEVEILHYGGVSSGIKKQSQNITQANIETKKKIQNARFNAMRIFYQKNYKDKYPAIIGWLVQVGINILYKLNIPKLKPTKPQ